MGKEAVLGQGSAWQVLAIAMRSLDLHQLIQGTTRTLSCKNCQSASIMHGKSRVIWIFRTYPLDLCHPYKFHFASSLTVVSSLPVFICIHIQPKEAYTQVTAPSLPINTSLCASSGIDLSVDPGHGQTWCLHSSVSVLILLVVLIALKLPSHRHFFLLSASHSFIHSTSTCIKD